MPKKKHKKSGKHSKKDNKLRNTILITVGILLLISLVAASIYYFTKSDHPCGDDICTPNEQRNKLCPQDCNDINNRLQPVVIELSNDCDPEDYQDNTEIFKKEFDDRTIFITQLLVPDIMELKDDDCVIRFSRPNESQVFLNEIKPMLEEERNKKIQELKLNRTIHRKDVLDQDELEDFLRQQHPDLPDEAPEGGIMSPYQLYVTPENQAVIDYLEDLETKEEIYEAALSWVWVSETTLNNEEEKWLTPEEFLEDTPSYRRNPARGSIASDCSEQANTLASLLIASGLYDETDVRVVLGLVDFGGSTGGHAWVEVYEDDEWFSLEPTAGNYYDDDLNRLITVDTSTVPYEYFRYYEFPAITIWYYYNNKYFTDVKTQRGNAPTTWKQMAKSYFQERITNMQNRVNN